jgi:hypothetical protein
MTIDELKTGMTIQLRDGWKGLVLKDCDCEYDKTTKDVAVGTDGDYVVLSDYNDDLTAKYNLTELDIMFVYNPLFRSDVLNVLNDIDNGTETHDCTFNREWEERNKK